MVCQVFLFFQWRIKGKESLHGVNKSHVQRQIYIFKSVSLCLRQNEALSPHSVHTRSLLFSSQTHSNFNNESAQRTASRCYKLIVANIVQKYFVLGEIIKKGLVDSLDSAALWWPHTGGKNLNIFEGK